MRISNKKSFTVIKFLIAIVILAILATIMIRHSIKVHRQTTQSVQRTLARSRRIRSIFNATKLSLETYAGALADSKDEELGVIMTNTFPPPIPPEEIGYIDVQKYSKNLADFRGIIKSNPEPETVSSAVFMMAMTDFRSRLNIIENKMLTRWDIADVFFRCLGIVIAISVATIGVRKYFKRR